MQSTVSKLFRPTLRVGVARSLSATAPLRERFINHVQLLGRVGRDPEQYGDANPVVSFPLATTQTVRTSHEDEDGNTERNITSWHNVTVWPAPFRKYVQDVVIKGSRVIVNGSLSYQKSTQPDGSVRVRTHIKASELILLSTPRQGDDGQRGSQDVDMDYNSIPEPELR